MQLYFDESGGADPASNVFMVAGVAVDSLSAGRLIKSFRKASGTTGEIKGSGMSLVHRRLFFEILGRNEAVLSAAVHVHREQSLGGWAMGALAESDLYAELLSEAICWIPPMTGSVALLADGGRYKRAVYDAMTPGIEAKAAAHHGGRASLRFVTSHEHPGVQIADVISNSMYQLVTGFGMPDQLEDILGPFLQTGKLRMGSAELASIRPHWM